MKKQVSGVYTALVTPFLADGTFDEQGLRHNIRYQISFGIEGLVPLGTTGEAPTLSSNEKERVIQIAVEEGKGKAIIMVGTGSYSTQQAIENSLKAERLGADSVLVVSPYYNKPTQEGVYLHFKAIHDAISIPIVVYNIQGRTGMNIQTSTLRRLAQLPRIVGVKEASGNFNQINEVIEVMRRERKDFSVMSGDDANTFPLMALGGNGIISVVSNLIPHHIKQLVTLLSEGDYEQARVLHYQLMPIFRDAFIETNPIPIKAAMTFAGMPAGGCRLPLCDLLPENRKVIQNSLKALSKELSFNQKPLFELNLV